MLWGIIAFLAGAALAHLTSRDYGTYVGAIYGPDGVEDYELIVTHRRATLSATRNIVEGGKFTFTSYLKKR